MFTNYFKNFTNIFILWFYAFLNYAKSKLEFTQKSKIILNNTLNIEKKHKFYVILKNLNVY